MSIESTNSALSVRTRVAVAKQSAASSLTDKYCIILTLALAAYAVAGRGFAYMGIPPLYISEILLFLGLLTLGRTKAILATLAVAPAMLMSILMAFVIVRTVPYVSTYGMDATRDSVIVVYGLFAFVVAGLLLEQPGRVTKAVRFLRRFTTVYVFGGPAVYMLNVVQAMPKVPGSGIPILGVRPGELAVHLSACAVMAIVRLRPATICWTVMLSVGVAIVGSQNRGGFLAILVPVALALFLTDRWRKTVPAIIGIFLAFGLAWSIDLKIPTKRDDGRSMGARQVVENFATIISSSGTSEQDDTAHWRKDWWSHIFDYTFHGPYFWTGKGFGVNLSIADGFVLSADPAGGTLRSPHNSHMTMLARTGVPGITIWCLFAFSWMWMVLACARRAWSLQDRAWGDLLLFIACYWLSIMIDASFDVVLEGPMLGIWFWCLTGFGIGTVIIYNSAIHRNGRRALNARE